MFEKPKSIKNPKLLKHLRRLPCIACHGFPTEIDHIRSIGAGGDDSPDNVWPLCRACHSLRHSIGIESFVKQFELPVQWVGSYPVLKKPWTFR
jgi:5-methylcytosine-specific restriction endonuclease McrA